MRERGRERDNDSHNEIHLRGGEREEHTERSNNKRGREGERLRVCEEEGV